MGSRRAANGLRTAWAGPGAGGTLWPQSSNVRERGPVLHRELTASDFNDAVLLDLLRIEDPLGVLSVFVEMPADGADRRAEIEIKNKLIDLERRAGGNGSLLRAEALRSTLAVVMPALERLLDPQASGRGGAVFAALSGPELITLATPMPLASRVVLDSRPFVRPLLELLDEGEPAGVVLDLGARGRGARLAPRRAAPPDPGRSRAGRGARTEHDAARPARSPRARSPAAVDRRCRRRRVPSRRRARPGAPADQR